MLEIIEACAAIWGTIALVFLFRRRRRQPAAPEQPRGRDLNQPDIYGRTPMGFSEGLVGLTYPEDSMRIATWLADPAIRYDLIDTAKRGYDRYTFPDGTTVRLEPLPLRRQ